MTKNEIKKNTLDQKNYKTLVWSTESGVFKLQNNIINRLAVSLKYYKIVDSNFRMKHHMTRATKQIVRMRK
jgi:hypothetical protein